MPLLVSPCATPAILPPQELTAQQMVSKVLLYSGLNGSMKAQAGQRFYSEGPPLTAPLAFQTPGTRVTARGAFSAQRGRGRGHNPCATWAGRGPPNTDSEARPHADFYQGVAIPRFHLLSMWTSSRFLISQNVGFTVPDAKGHHLNHDTIYWTLN